MRVCLQELPTQLRSQVNSTHFYTQIIYRFSLQLNVKAQLKAPHCLLWDQPMSPTSTPRGP